MVRRGTQRLDPTFHCPPYICKAHLIDWPPARGRDGTPLPESDGFRVLLPHYKLSRASIPDVHKAITAGSQQESLVWTEGKMTHSLPLKGELRKYGELSLESIFLLGVDGVKVRSA